MEGDIYEWVDDDWVDIEDDTPPEEEFSTDYDTDEELEATEQDANQWTRPTLWTQVRIDGEIYEVSTTGRYKRYDTFESSEGIVLQGTPFRYAVIGGKRYFMHELVWQTHYGPAPDGWEIRHKHEYVSIRPRKVYSNHLANITIYPRVVAQQAIMFS